MSFATVTPSFVTWGAPNFFPITTFLPFGPNVTFTASANVSTPDFNPLRASVLNLMIFLDITYFFFFFLVYNFYINITMQLNLHV